MADSKPNDEELKDSLKESQQGIEEDVKGHGVDEEDDGEAGVFNINCGC